MVERCQKGSLYNLHHRESANAIYLDYIRGAEPMPAAEHDLRFWLERVTERANSIVWSPDGDVVLRCQKLGLEIEIIPDAVIASRREKARVFLEVDRSTKSLARIEQNLERYDHYLRERYQTDFPDGRTPHVIYVVHSTARRAHVTAACRRTLAGRCSAEVLLCGKTTAWLERALLGGKSTAPVEPAVQQDNRLHAAARRMLFWTNEFLKDLQKRGVLERLEGERGDFLREGNKTLVALCRELGVEVHHGG
jgi:hypothetical protein